MALNAQEDLSRRLVDELMKGRSLHIDASPSADEAKHLKLDLANAKSTQVLKKLAQDATRAAFRKPKVRAFFQTIRCRVSTIRASLARDQATRSQYVRSGSF